MALRVGIALVCGTAIPLHSLAVVLRHALADDIHGAEHVLRFGIALVGQRTQQPVRGCVVFALIRSLTILQRPGNGGSCDSHQHERCRQRGTM